MDLTTMQEQEMASPPQFYAHPAAYFPSSMPQSMYPGAPYGGQVPSGDKHNAYTGQGTYPITQTPMSATLYPTGIHMPMYSMYPGYSSPHMATIDMYSARQQQTQIVGPHPPAIAYASPIQQNSTPIYRNFSSQKNNRIDRRLSLENKNQNFSGRSVNNSLQKNNENKNIDHGNSRNNTTALQTVNSNKLNLSTITPSDTSTSKSQPTENANIQSPTVSVYSDFPIPIAISPHPNAMTFSLEESLKNPRNTTNVYIRGLAPNTTDEVLVKIVSRFGNLTTAKAMMDSSTGMCKGFGFAQFATEEEAVQCICGLAQYGYQTSFAKQSFALRLKELQDIASTNVYFSNIPRTWDKTEFKQLLESYSVVSLKVLRDPNGNNRGVGFARFTDRNVAEEIISKFNGQPIGESGTPIQVRFSDTEAQKKLKQITVKKRNWRAHEYHVLAAQRAMEEFSIGNVK
ncbi:hypothetical protein V1511DRAFT_521223 [Dipodascopsis uninucleata]